MMKIFRRSKIGFGFSLFQQRKPIMAMLRDTRQGTYRISLWTKVLFVLTIVYLLSPFDLIPDFLVIVGWTDDLAIVALFMARLQSELKRYYRSKAMSRKGCNSSASDFYIS